MRLQLRFLYNLILSPLVTTAFYVSLPVPREDVITCGSTPAEAKQLGCAFDLFSFAYYPPPCYNKNLHDEFLALHSSEIGWRTMNYTPIPIAKVLKGNHIDLRPISGQFHDLHCTYEWLRLIRSLAEERPLDRKLARYVHSHHCSMNLLQKDKTGRNETATQTASMLFGRCGLTADQMHSYGAE